jgi:hypothetical protein
MTSTGDLVAKFQFACGVNGHAVLARATWEKGEDGVDGELSPFLSKVAKNDFLAKNRRAGRALGVLWGEIFGGALRPRLPP